MMLRAVQKEEEVEKMGSHGRTVFTQEKIEKRERERERKRGNTRVQKREQWCCVEPVCAVACSSHSLSSVITSGVMGDPPAYRERLYRWLIVQSAPEKTRGVLSADDATTTTADLACLPDNNNNNKKCSQVRRRRRCTDLVTIGKFSSGGGARGAHTASRQAGVSPTRRGFSEGGGGKV